MHENIDEESEDIDFCPILIAISIASRESIISKRENNVARGIRKGTRRYKLTQCWIIQ